MLLKLLASFRNEGPDGEVLCLGPEGPIADPIRGLGIPVTSLGLGAGVRAFLRFPRLVGEMKRARPDLVHCWMYHANLLGGLAARVAGSPPVLWGLRQSNFDPRHSKKQTVAVAHLCGYLSRRVPRRILCVSESARVAHGAMGYDTARMVVIPNGFDGTVFRPDSSAREKLRRELGLGSDALLVGLVARFDPQKDIGNFLAAAARVAAAKVGTRFVLCGEGMDHENSVLAGMIGANGLNGCTHLLGFRSDIPYITAALDIASSSSAFGEGFSNALGEALACGVPTVATDVGDCRLIVGDSGRVVVPCDPDALANALGDLIDLGRDGRARLGALGRVRIMRDYGIEAIARRYHHVYAETLEESLRQ